MYIYCRENVGICTLREVIREFVPCSSEFIFLASNVVYIEISTLNNDRRSKVLGPDYLTSIMLKHLGPIATSYLTTFNKHVTNVKSKLQ